jgi:hypothetical protein
MKPSLFTNCRHGVPRSTFCGACSERNWRTLRAARAAVCPELHRPIIEAVADRILEELNNDNGAVV